MVNFDYKARSPTSFCNPLQVDGNSQCQDCHQNVAAALAVVEQPCNHQTCHLEEVVGRRLAEDQSNRDRFRKRAAL